VKKWLAGAAICALAGLYFVYRRDLNASVAKLDRQSRIAKTSHGPVEYVSQGSGPELLVIHGAGGGFDQGLLVAEVFAGADFRTIVPSRFGYLRSALPADPSPAAQADAFAELLDQLGISKLAVLAISGGVPPALQLAIRHKDRVSALVLISSAPYTPLSAGDQQLPIPAWLYQAIFGWDLPYWLLKQVAKPGVEKLFDVKPYGRSNWTEKESRFLRRMIDSFLPVSRRQAGLANEGAAIHPDAKFPLSQIDIPALVIHARDDGINPVAFGRYTASQIPGAKLIEVESGGHLLLGHQAALSKAIQEFLTARP